MFDIPFNLNSINANVEKELFVEETTQIIIDFKEKL